MRKEQDIFDDLVRLCSSPGYIHTIAYFSFRDNMVAYTGDMKAGDMQHMFSSNRLVRTEISTLIGLLIKGKIDYTLPAPSKMEEYLKRTEALLEEVHRSMAAAMTAGLDPKKVAQGGLNPFTRGGALREPIFYGGESAYSFQYRDLSVKKYVNDDDWLALNKGFSIRIVRDVVHAIGKVQTDKLTDVINSLRGVPPEGWTILPGFTFTVREVSEYASIDKDLAEKILTAFAVPEEENNTGFRSLHDFNIVNASPILRRGNDEFILFQDYSLLEAVYESPFYWMSADKSYLPVAMQHRGQFTEEFSRERLEHVFGKDRVYSNVDIFESKGKKAGEIDVLVIFGNRAIVLQAKSKRLTLEARRGNDGQIRDDFKKSIQDSYDQGYLCASLLADTKYKLIDADSKEITRPPEFREIYIFCVVSDHYPALSFQARQFLKTKTSKTAQSPMIIDVFTLDAMTEMLESPLRMLSYVNRRSQYYNKLRFFQELTVLSYHLRNNLWLEDKYSFVSLSEDIAADLDVAMMVRRNGVQGKRTPDGILTRLSGTTLGRFVSEIEAKPDPSTIDLGFMVLTLNENTFIKISSDIDKIMSRAKRDRKNHDLTAGIGGGSTGLIIHCNEDPISIAWPRLQAHCEMRKYTERADSWFGLCISPNKTVRFGLQLDYKWKQSVEMDTDTRSLPRHGKSSNLPSTSPKRKIGRNEPCPCGSGLKHKKCHGK